MCSARLATPQKKGDQDEIAIKAKATRR